MWPKNALIALLVTIFGLVPAAIAHAQDATIELTVYKVGFIVGGGGGRGTLSYQGKNYPLKVGGISLGATIGASRVDMVGEVYNLSKPEDIVGTYSAIGASAVLAGGGGVAELQNAKGVKMTVWG